MHRFRSLQFKASLVSVLLIIFISLVVSFYSFKSFERSLVNSMQERSQNLTAYLARSSEYWLWIKDAEKLSSIIALTLSERDTRYVVFYGPDGSVLASNFKNLSVIDAIKTAEPILESFLPVYSARLDIEDLEGGDLHSRFIGRVAVGLSLTSVNQTIRKTGYIISAITLALMLIGILITLVLMRYILRPIKELKDTAYAISHGNLDLRANVLSQDEIGDMAGSFNLMAEKLSGIVKETRSYLESLIEDSIDAIISFDFSLNTVSWNKGAQHIFGFSEKEVIGSPLPIFAGEHLNELSHVVGRVKKGERIHPKESLCLKKDGLQIPVFYSASPIRDARGQIIGISAIIKDLTEVKKVEKMKADLLSVISHELRTPIAIIQGNLSNIIDGILGPIEGRAKDALLKIQSQAEHLIRLVNTVLDISRIGMGGRLEIEKSPLAFDKFLQGILALYEPRFKIKQIGLNLDIPSALPELMADQNHLARLIVNLVENALKFTDENGRINISVKNADGGLEFSIQDSGIGIEAANLDKVFDKFYQVDSTYTRAAGGIGMGLTIAKEIVQAHGGRIWVESEGIGKGSRVTLQIPLI